MIENQNDALLPLTRNSLKPSKSSCLIGIDKRMYIYYLYNDNILINIEMN